MNYFKRDIEFELQNWIDAAERQPILLRGARQVGKTTTIRKLSKKFKYFAEINFELLHRSKLIFSGDFEAKRICQELSVLSNTPIIEGETLLFLDEIQACPPAIAALRYFYEQMPCLHVIAAGSLLEFALEDIVTFGVGRIQSLFLFPLSFGEFLEANGASLLRQSIENASPRQALPETLHQKAIEYFKRFLIIGGMPKIVSLFIKTGNLLECQKQLENLIVSFEDDFAKYKKQNNVPLLREVFRAVVAQCTQKFVIAKAAQEYSGYQIKTGLELLTLAGLIIPVTRTSANGIPLGAEIATKIKKYLILDTGIFQRINRTDIAQVLINNDFEVINKGVLAELFVGLELLKAGVAYQRPELYYWQREAKNSNAEIDYLIQKNENIIPIEVKSGTKGSMQSLQIFMESKNSKYGIRTSLENFGEMGKIKIFPLYAVANIMK